MTDRAIAVVRVATVVDGIHVECPPRACTRKWGPQVTAQTATGSDDGGAPLPRLAVPPQPGDA